MFIANGRLGDISYRELLFFITKLLYKFKSNMRFPAISMLSKRLQECQLYQYLIKAVLCLLAHQIELSNVYFVKWEFFYTCSKLKHFYEKFIIFILNRFV